MLLANENAISSGNYIISNSLRFQSASSQYLSRTPSVAGNRKTWTFSAWVKRGNLATGTGQILFSTGPTGAGQTWNQYYFETDNTLRVIQFIGGSASYGRQSNAIYRDPSAWYHVVILYDTTQAINTNRLRFFVNGSEISTTTSSGYSDYPSLNYDGQVNSIVAHGIGGIASNSYLDGYMTEINFIDGQALTPSSFGATDPTSGQWVAAKYTGTYGTNGFYLPFSNGTSTTTLGNDSSGNGNNWTLTNFTRSAGRTDCWMTDVPSGNSGASATQPNSNYATLLALRPTLGQGSYQASNLEWNQSSAGAGSYVCASIGAFSGKWYAEFSFAGSVNATSTEVGFGTMYNIFPAVGYKANGTNDSGGAFGASYTTGDILGIAYDSSTNTATFYKNNVSQGTQSFTIDQTLGGTFFAATIGTGSIIIANFGQRSFAYTPPSGFKALCTANLPVATIKQGNKYMDATLYSGNSSTQTITNAAGFKPDLIWIKSRSNIEDNVFSDSVRGATKYLVSNTTAAEVTDATAVTSFNSNGWTMGSFNQINYGTGPATYVGWQWQAGQGTTSSNTNGSITSTVSVNATAGFSIVTYTGTGANATVGHGLGVAPSMIIVKCRSNARDWNVQHSALGNTKVIYLDLTNAAAVDASVWNNTSPTSSTFAIGTSLGVNASTNTYVAYCFAEIAGFSKFGSYTGNGSTDGPFIYTGFQPKYVMVKRTDTTGNWNILDAARNPYNLTNLELQANLSAAEYNGTATNEVQDFLSNGFKLRGTGADSNANGGTYIYMAFASNPFANSNAR